MAVYIVYAEPNEFIQIMYQMTGRFLHSVFPRDWCRRIVSPCWLRDYKSRRGGGHDAANDVQLDPICLLEKDKSRPAMIHIWKKGVTLGEDLLKFSFPEYVDVGSDSSFQA